MTTGVVTNKNCVSPFLRRVLSRSSINAPSQHRQSNNLLHPKNDSQQKQIMMAGDQDSRRSESRMSSGSSSGKSAASDGMIDISTEENVQFMDQPLRGRIELSDLPAPIESVAIGLKGVVKTCVAGNAAWASGFGGESSVMARFTEKEILKQEFTLHPVAQPATPLSPNRRHSFPFVFLFPGAANLPPSMVFPQGLGCVEYTLTVVLKGKKKFGSAKKWSTTLVLKVELSRRAIGARLEQTSIADAVIPQTKHMIMLEHPRIILPGYTNHYFTLHFPQGLLQVHTFEATLVQRSFYKALGGNYRGASMVGLVCRVGQAEANVRDPGMDKVHVEIQELAEEGLESSVEVDGIIERKHSFRLEVSVVVFKRGVEKVQFEIPVLVQCSAVPASHADRRGTMSSMASASSSNLRYMPSESSANLRSSKSIGHFPAPPVRSSMASATIFDASPPVSPTEVPANHKPTRMNSKTWRDDELPGLGTTASSTPQLASPVRLEPHRTRSRQARNWTLIKPGIATLDSLAAPTPPPTCPIPDIPVNVAPLSQNAPIIPPRSSSRLASARQACPTPTPVRTTDELGRRVSQDTMTTTSVESSPSDYSGRHSTTSTAATSVSSSPSEVTAPLKTRGALSLRKVEEMGSGEPLRQGFDTRIFRVEPEKEKEIDREEFQRRIDLALSEVEKLAMEESDGELEEQALKPSVRLAAA